MRRVPEAGASFAGELAKGPLIHRTGRVAACQCSGPLRNACWCRRPCAMPSFAACFRAQWPQTPSQWPVTIPMTNSSIEVANGWGDWLRGVDLTHRPLGYEFNTWFWLDSVIAKNQSHTVSIYLIDRKSTRLNSSHLGIS